MLFMPEQTNAMLLTKTETTTEQQNKHHDVDAIHVVDAGKGEKKVLMILEQNKSHVVDARTKRKT